MRTPQAVTEKARLNRRLLERRVAEYSVLQREVDTLTREAGVSDATGATHSVREFVTWAAEAAGFDLECRGKAEGETMADRRSGRTVVRVNLDLYRPAEVELLVGDASKAWDILGWAPAVTVKELVQRMVTADLERGAGGQILA